MSGKTSPPETENWTVENGSAIFDDPLIDCLEIIARLHDRPISRTVLRSGLPLVNNRLTVELIARAARRAGFTSRVLKRSLSDMRTAELPAILLLKDRRAIVALAADRTNKTLQVVFPESQGMDELSIQELQPDYLGVAIFIKPKYRITSRHIDKPSERSGGWFWGTLFSSWRLYRDAFVATFLINAFALATPFFIINAYDRIVPNNAFDTLWVLSAGMIFIYFFELILRGLRGYFIDIAGKKSNLTLSSMLFEKVCGLRLEARPKSVGSFTKKLQQFESIRDFITSLSITALIDLPFTGLALLAIWYIGNEMVWIVITSMIVIILYSAFLQIPLKNSVKQSFQAEAQKNAILVEGISGIETIKVLGAESKIQRAWEESVSFISTWSARTRFLSSSMSHVSNFLQNLCIIFVIISGAYMVSNGKMTGGGLLACVIIARRAISPMTQVVNLMTRFHQSRNALKTLNNIMNLPSERPADKIFLHRAEIKGEISLHNLSFTYPEHASEVLSNINLTIQPGEKVGIIGPIGSGKTTLGKLLLGLYEPSNGMVAVDGTDIRQIDPAELRNFIGYVPQDVVLFRGSVRENIILGATEVDDAQILQAAKIAGVSQFVEQHPMGFDLPIEEMGRNLSGGQRQTIAIARAILLDPPILVMDEPTSSMDARTEQMIRKRLLSIMPGKTTIIITHRTSLLEIVDRIVVISNKTVVADGTRQRILEALKNGHVTL